MKTKRMKGKLIFNKTTISHLDNVNMEHVKGGAFTDDTCGSCHPITYCWGCLTLICPDIRTEQCN